MALRQDVWLGLISCRKSAARFQQHMYSLRVIVLPSNYTDIPMAVSMKEHGFVMKTLSMNQSSTCISLIKDESAFIPVAVSLKSPALSIVLKTPSMSQLTACIPPVKEKHQLLASFKPLRKGKAACMNCPNTKVTRSTVCNHD
ncbi:uncharacterized protein LOC123535105 [Mercenaria mercenaria]|uniref:uncharacterized protein LOC123535105 n=1 Tax=Mercenaria mercenaria TaxID=6596 RepID=UPI00234F1E0F|nr:uncharacterized protein LOC123535105 [Mercenaria mercenaria]